MFDPSRTASSASSISERPSASHARNFSLVWFVFSRLRNGLSSQQVKPHAALGHQDAEYQGRLTQAFAKRTNTLVTALEKMEWGLHLAVAILFAAYG